MAGARRSAQMLEMLLLSLLNSSDSLSGYQVAAILGDRIVLIWPVKHNQIYPVLARLEANRDATGEWVDQTGRPNKKTYRITQAGRERLRSWLLQPRSTLSDDEIMLITYNLGLIGSAAVTASLAAYREQCAEEAALLEARWLTAVENVERGEAEDETRILRLTGIRSIYDHALMARDARIRWCGSVLTHARKVVAGLPAGSEKTG